MTKSQMVIRMKNADLSEKIRQLRLETLTKQQRYHKKSEKKSEKYLSSNIKITKNKKWKKNT